MNLIHESQGILNERSAFGTPLKRCIFYKFVADSVAIRREAYAVPRGKPFSQVIGYKLKITGQISATPTRTADGVDRPSELLF